MKIALLGSDTVAGQALASSMSSIDQLTTYGLQQVCQLDVNQLSQSNDVIIFCGDASKSSWDSTFGDLTRDLKTIPDLCAAAGDHDCQLVFLSSDAVFSGPWLFHDESAERCNNSMIARQLTTLEDSVLSTAKGTVIRSNILGSSSSNTSFVDDLFEIVITGNTYHADATSFGSPIMSDDFARAVSGLLQQLPTGVLHLSGAERTTPWNFAVHLVTAMGLARNLVQPANANGCRSERALRCERITCELGLRLPTLSESLDTAIESLQSHTELSAAA